MQTTHPNKIHVCAHDFCHQYVQSAWLSIIWQLHPSALILQSHYCCSVTTTAMESGQRENQNVILTTRSAAPELELPDHS